MSGSSASDSPCVRVRTPLKLSLITQNKFQVNLPLAMRLDRHLIIFLLHLQTWRSNLVHFVSRADFLVFAGLKYTAPAFEGVNFVA